MKPENHAVPQSLRAGQRVRDAVFDLVYPENVRRVSARYWTPIDVAVTVARWLQARERCSVLDVGSGAGKFCIVANLTAKLRVSGLEQREPLLEIARAATSAYQAQVDYLHGTLETIEPAGFDAFYMFNPFGENLYDPREQFDREAELSALRWLNDVSIMEYWLDHAPEQTCLVTYHGFGGRIPATYELVRTLEKRSGPLRMWCKTKPGQAETFQLEVNPAGR
jgi:predicted RNA methylase